VEVAEEFGVVWVLGRQRQEGGNFSIVTLDAARSGRLEEGPDSSEAFILRLDQDLVADAKVVVLE